MSNTQGNLEALAALCGTQSDAQARGAAGNEATGTTTTGSKNDASSQGNNDSSSKPNQQQPPVQGLAHQQWQQALATVAALQQAHSNQGAGISVQSLLLSGLPQQGISTSTAEQLALQRYLQQANITAAQQAILAQSMGGYTDPNHALIMALAGKAQQQGTNGESTFLLEVIVHVDEAYSCSG